MCHAALNWNVLTACRMLCGIPISFPAWTRMFPLTAESEFALWRCCLLGRAGLPTNTHTHIYTHIYTQTHIHVAKTYTQVTQNASHPGQPLFVFCPQTVNQKWSISSHSFTAGFSFIYKKNKQTLTGSLQRWKQEFQNTHNLFAQDMLLHWYVPAIASSRAWDWWP